MLIFKIICDQWLSSLNDCSTSVQYEMMTYHEMLNWGPLTQLYSSSKCTTYSVILCCSGVFFLLHKNIGLIIFTGSTDALTTCLDYFSHSSQTQENHRATTTFKIMCHYESLQKWLGISSIATLTLIIWQMLAYNMSM